MAFIFSALRAEIYDRSNGHKGSRIRHVSPLIAYEHFRSPSAQHRRSASHSGGCLRACPLSGRLAGYRAPVGRAVRCSFPTDRHLRRGRLLAGYSPDAVSLGNDLRPNGKSWARHTSLPSSLATDGKVRDRTEASYQEVDAPLGRWNVARRYISFARFEDPSSQCVRPRLRDTACARHSGPFRLSASCSRMAPDEPSQNAEGVRNSRESTEPKGSRTRLVRSRFYVLVSPRCPIRFRKSGVARIIRKRKGANGWNRRACDRTIVRHPGGEKGLCHSSCEHGFDFDIDAAAWTGGGPRSVETNGRRKPALSKIHAGPSCRHTCTLGSSTLRHAADQLAPDVAHCSIRKVGSNARAGRR